MKRMVLILGLLVVFALLPVSLTFAQVSITADENGNGTLTETPGSSTTLPHAQVPDPYSGQITLFYDMMTTPLVTEGDVIIHEGGISGPIGDLIRFDNNISLDSDPGGFFFYSDKSNGVDSLADTVVFGSSVVGVNQVNIAEVNGIASYTPNLGNPGFVPGFVVSYTFASDVPEPSTMLLFGSGLAALAAYNLRKRVKGKISSPEKGSPSKSQQSFFTFLQHVKRPARHSNGSAFLHCRDLPTGQFTLPLRLR